jgi:type IV pilus biogenesis protein PilP
MENALSSLALDLSHEGISLYRLESGAWVALDHIPLQVGTLKANMARLRKMADKAGGKVVVWMPDEQVHVLEVELVGLSGTDLNRAINSAFAVSGRFQADALEYHVGTKRNGAMTPVAAISKDVLQEAREFIADHGFTATGFSTRSPIAELGERPVFAATKQSNLVSHAIAAAAGLAMAVGVGSVVWNSLDLFTGSRGPAVEVTSLLPPPGQEGAPVSPGTESSAVAPDLSNSSSQVTPPEEQHSFAAYYAFPDDENAIQIAVPSVSAEAEPEETEPLPGPDASLSTQRVAAALDPGQQEADAIPNIFTGNIVDQVVDLPQLNGSELGFTSPSVLDPATRAHVLSSLDIRPPETRTAQFVVPEYLPPLPSPVVSDAVAQPPVHFPVHLQISRGIDDSGKVPAVTSIATDAGEPGLQPSVASAADTPVSQDTILVATSSDMADLLPGRIGGIEALPSVPLIPASFSTDAFVATIPAWQDTLPPPRPESAGEEPAATEEAVAASDPNPETGTETEIAALVTSAETTPGDTPVDAATADATATQAEPEGERVASIEPDEITAADIPVFDRLPPVQPPERDPGAGALAAVNEDKPVEDTITPDQVPVVATAPPINPHLRPREETGVAAVAPATEATPAEEDTPVAEETDGSVTALIEQALAEEPEHEPVVDDILPIARPNGLVPEAEPEPAGPVRSRYALFNSDRPRQRPDAFAQQIIRVATAPATAPVPAPDPAPAPAPAQPKVQLPTSASVQQAATSRDAINLRDINLIGVSGSDGRRTAIVRMPNGKIVSVKTGDKFSGYQVAAIGRNAIRLRKNGRDTVLEIPD